jgi:hypothetical protein
MAAGLFLLSRLSSSFRAKRYSSLVPSGCK